jgi:hypothetical protein
MHYPDSLPSKSQDTELATEATLSTPWFVVVTVNPITSLIADAWLTGHGIDRNKVICVSERGFCIAHCHKVIDKGLDKLINSKRIKWTLGVAKEAAWVYREVAQFTGGQEFILLKANLRDPLEHVLHLSKHCAGAYYMEEGSASHHPWEQQRLYWSSLRVWVMWSLLLVMLANRLSGLRLSEIFQIEGNLILGYIALSGSAFPGRDSVEIISPPKIHDTAFDAVFLGDDCVEVGYYDKSERERWLAAVAADLQLRGVRKLGIRVHPSERFFSYEDYKDYFERATDGQIQTARFVKSPDLVTPRPHTPLYQILSSAAIYGKDSGFEMISMKLKPTNMRTSKLARLAAAEQLLDQYVTSWLGQSQH